MMFLITGGMGAGKTLNALKQVRDLQVQSGRPVCYTNRIELQGPALEFGWKKIDIKEWEKEPDGTIFLVDECHKDFPVRAGVSQPPAHVQNLAEHRHRGFDFFLVTQHPKNIDSFIRRLIGNPGWHKHLKRRSGAPLVTVLKWDSVYERCESPSSGDSAELSHVPYPKEVFSWYKSATIHTAKFKLPKAFWMFAGGLVAVAVLLAFAYVKLRSSSGAVPAVAAAPDSKGGGLLGGMAGLSTPAKAAPGGPARDKPEAMTTAEYLESHRQRVPGLAYSAPRYDDITKPRQAPYPAACMQMGNRCSCFTQQATPLQVSEHMCQQIVKSGIFLDFLPTDAERRREEVASQRADKLAGGAGAERSSVPAAPASAVSMPVAAVLPAAPGWEERKAMENAQVVSKLRPNYPGR